MWAEIDTQIDKATGKAFVTQQRKAVSGGCINQGYSLSDGSRTFFVKLNKNSQVLMFEAEALALKQMFKTSTIRVPQPICYGIVNHFAYIVLEWLEVGRGSDKSARKMGRNLAKMHQKSLSNRFGWDKNNTIGSTPQINDWMDNWKDFWIQNRLRYQLQLAERKGGSFSQVDKLLEIIPDLLADYEPVPSLVHGDLWGGSTGFTAEGESVIFDPAAYFGDREVDIAMTELFGGFSSDFYQGYNEILPLDKGYSKRKNVYNLYHILNHYNLFGVGYISQVNGMISQILRG